MRKTRLLLVLFALTLTALCSLTAVPVSSADVPYDYCWQFSNEDCVYYYYNSATGCCEGLRNHPRVPVCPDVCE